MNPFSVVVVISTSQSTHNKDALTVISKSFFNGANETSDKNLTSEIMLNQPFLVRFEAKVPKL